MAQQRDLEAAVQACLNQTKRGFDEHRRRVTKYNQSYDIYRANSAGRARKPWQSSLRIPYSYQTVNTVLVNIARGSPSCKVTPRHPGVTEENAEAFQLVLNYFAREDGLALKQVPLVQQALVYGVTVGKTHWLLRETERPGKTWDIDPLTGEPVSQTGMQKLTLYDGPSFEPWDLYDVVWDPNGRDVDSCAYIVLRSWLSKADMERNRCTTDGSHDWWECDGLYHNLEALYETGTGNRRDVSSSQDRLLGGDLNLRKDRFEVWEVWRDDQVTVVGNRQVLLRDTPNPHWHGQKPVVIASCQPDIFKVQGVSETEVLADIQEALWTLQNMRFDNLNLTVNRGITYREGGVIDPGALELRPLFKWPVTDHDDIRPFEIQPLPPEAYREEESLMGLSQQMSGVNAYVTGANSTATGVDQNTATGVATLSEVASRLLSFKRYLIQVGVWNRVFKQWGQYCQQYMDTPAWVRIEGPSGQTSFRQVSPQEVAGEYDFQLEGADEQLSQAQERSDAIQLLQVLTPLVQAGVVDLKPVLEKVARSFKLDNPDALLKAAPSVPAAAPYPQQPQAPEQPGLLNGNMPQQAQTAIMSGQG